VGIFKANHRPTHASNGRIRKKPIKQKKPIHSDRGIAFAML